jgi:hypothetical protein
MAMPQPMEKAHKAHFLPKDSPGQGGTFTLKVKGPSPVTMGLRRFDRAIHPNFG